ncbi:MAG: redoxin domain-containing protein, partial [Cyanobacteria bacterium REEB65]|nr:redoxin domain-containing protein [Cyanobacteria bacterium REEB65]
MKFFRTNFELNGPRSWLRPAILGLAIAVGTLGHPGKAGAVGEPDRPQAPAFTLHDLKGHAVSLADFKGRVVLLNFWATWCPPCRFEIPAIVRVYNRFRSKGLVVLGVSMDDDPAKTVPGFLADFKKAKHVAIDYPILQGDDDVASLYGGIRGIPTTFLIDRQGRIAGRHVGPPGD